MNINYDKRIFGLDLVRSLAIILVIISHSIWIVPIKSSPLKELVNLSGYLGVEIFFVLSGFLIGRILFRLYHSTRFTVKEVGYFLIRRWFRTLPNYYLILLVNILITILIGINLPKDLWQYIFFIQNFNSPMPHFFGESWSLSIEEFAYILGPFLLYILLFLRLKLSRERLFLWTTITIVFSFFVLKVCYNAIPGVSDMSIWNTNLKAVVIYRIDAIYYGVLAAYISEIYSGFWSKYKYYGMLLGSFIIVSLNIIIPQLGLFIETNPFFWNVLYLPINSIAIACMLPYFCGVKITSSYIIKPITFISLISYAMYLVHFSIVISLITYLQSKGFLEQSNFLTIIVYIVLTLVISYLIFRFFERPMTNLRDRKEIKNYFK